MATLDELKKVVTDCGGTINDVKNVVNTVYWNCYTTKGFTNAGGYWSAASNTSNAWLVNFFLGRAQHHTKSTYDSAIRCVKVGQ